MMVCKQVFSHRRNSDKGISLRDIMRYLKTSTLWLLVCMSVLLQLTCSGVLPHRFIQKRSCDTSTCITLRLAHFLSHSGGLSKATFLPTNVNAKSFGRRRKRIFI
nr:PREDICTED: islet amyloid polypeptide-like isoform X2 [Latimeria chalumnae]|eukprot:XP_005991017.1 PREDICTED: islet amyloid polypeptide-like isoform X2 [Latimeria chalumnae]